MKKYLIGMLMSAVLLSMTGPPAQAQQSSYVYSSEYATSLEPIDTDPPGELILADVLILRPLGIVSSVVGLAGSLVSLPFAASSGSEDLVARKLIREPFDYTWCRPLGDMDY